MDTTPTLTINRDGQQYGPYTVEQANGYLQAGSLLPTDLAWDAQKSAWVLLVQIPGILFAAPPPPPPAALTPAKERNVFLLIVMGFVWFVVLFFVPYFLLCVLAGAVAGGLHPDDAADAGREAGKTIGAIILFPIFFVSIGLSIWLTIIGKLPGTRK